MSDVVTIFSTGKIYWAKVIGAPRDNYEKTGKEWSLDFMPDDISFMSENGLADRIKTDAKGHIPGPYIRLRKNEMNKEGEKMPPIRIYDENNEDWDDRLLGNETKVVAKINIKDYGKGKKKGMYIQALRVEELVEFKSSDFGAYDKVEGKTFTKKAVTKRPVDDLDDDIPF